MLTEQCHQSMAIGAQRFQVCRIVVGMVTITMVDIQLNVMLCDEVASLASLLKKLPIELAF